MSESDNLNAAIVDLRRRRDEIDAAIATMERIRNSVYGAAPATETSSTSSTSTTSQASGRRRGGEARSERVRRIMESAPHETWTALDIALQLDETDQQQDGDVLKAINGITSRLHKRGLIHKVGHGEYQWSAPTDTSDPDNAGPEGDVTTTGTGGDSHAQGDRHHHSDPVQGRDADDRGGASVGGLT